MIKKRGHIYWLDLRADGKRIRQSLRTDEYGLAIERAAEIKARLIHPRREEVTFADFKRKYLEWAWSSHPASANREEQRLKKIEAFLLPHNIVYLTDITPWHIEQLKSALREKGRSPATANRYLQLLRGMFYRAIDWEMYAKPNPVKKVKFYREEPARRLLSRDEISRIIEAAEVIAVHPRSPLQRVFPDIVRLAVNTGLRKSEILNLRWSDIHGDEITVKGKGDRIRTVPLNDEAGKIIGRQIRREAKIFGEMAFDKTSTFRRTVEAIRKQTGIDWHFHLLRHRFTSTLLEHGIDLVTVSELLGHSRTMTSLVYSHTDPARKRQAVDTIMDTIARDMKPGKPAK